MKNIYSLTTFQKICYAGIVFCLFTIIFIYFPPQAVDFHYTFYKVAGNISRPYDQLYFNYPPWMALPLYPLHFFPEYLSRAINCSLSLVLIGSIVISRKGDRIALLLTLTSFPFLSMIANGAVEWIPAIGFLLQNAWGIPWLLAKPQTGILVALAWIDSLRKAVWFVLSGSLTILLSFLLWGNWVDKLISNLQFINSQFNLSDVNILPFPWAIPFGLALVFYIIKYRPADQELLGVLATFCLVPYMAVYSLAIAFALLSASKRRLSIVVWILLWLYPILHDWGIFSRIIGLK